MNFLKTPFSQHFSKMWSNSSPWEKSCPEVHSLNDFQRLQLDFLIYLVLFFFKSTTPFKKKKKTIYICAPFIFVLIIFSVFWPWFIHLEGSWEEERTYKVNSGWSIELPGGKKSIALIRRWVRIKLCLVTHISPDDDTQVTAEIHPSHSKFILLGSVFFLPTIL